MLYDIILKNEIQESEEVLVEIGKRLSMNRNNVLDITEKSFKVHVATTVLLLNEVYRQKGTKVTKDRLDYLFSQIMEIEQFGYGGARELPGIIPIRERGIRAILCYYSQLKNQDGIATSFEQAVRQQFKDESSYRRVLIPINVSNSMLYGLLSYESPKLVVQLSTALEAEIFVRERRIKEIFP